jgi:hypothetical protein
MAEYHLNNLQDKLPVALEDFILRQIKPKDATPLNST